MPSSIYISNAPIWESYDAVATTFFTRTMPLNSFVTVYIQAAAVKPSTGDTKSWYRTFICKRAGAGASVGTITNIFTPVADAGASTWDINIVASGNDILAQLTGQATSTIFWTFNILVIGGKN